MIASTSTGNNTEKSTNNESQHSRKPKNSGSSCNPGMETEWFFGYYFPLVKLRGRVIIRLLKGVVSFRIWYLFSPVAVYFALVSELLQIWRQDHSSPIIQ